MFSKLNTSPILLQNWVGYGSFFFLSSGKNSQYFANSANSIGSSSFSPNCTQRPIVLADLYNILFLRQILQWLWCKMNKFKFYKERTNVICFIFIAHNNTRLSPTQLGASLLLIAPNIVCIIFGVLSTPNLKSLNKITYSQADMCDNCGFLRTSMRL